MTHTEAADLILGAGGRPYWHFDGEITQANILAAVATVMDAARAEALEEAANICGTLAETTYDEADGFMAVLGCETAIRRRAQSHREPNP